MIETMQEKVTAVQSSSATSAGLSSDGHGFVGLGHQSREDAEHHPYLDDIFRISARYLKREFSQEQQEKLMTRCYNEIRGDQERTISEFIRIYYETVKQIHQSDYAHDEKLDSFLNSEQHKLKMLWGSCLDLMRGMKSESIQLMVTSPPYYNARDYSQWHNLDEYLNDMKEIIQECYRVLENHRPFVFNVGDIYDNDNLHTRSSWGKRRIPLGAYFTSIFEEVGFRFVDDFIWDKGEVQSQRHKNGDNPFPLYQYPVNCYEHIFVFYKHRKDETIYPCPICGCLKVNGNAYSGVGIKSWECKNNECMKRSAGNRGKRFSARSHIMTQLKSESNLVDEELLKKWRRDLVQFPPVIKINSKGKNILGHTAPFPREIPAYSIQAFSGVGETVLDPFAGSFTTPIEAILAGRHGIGIELNKRLFRKSIITNVRQHLSMFDDPWLEYDYAGG